MPQRDLFADFARMRREMDDLIGDVWGSSQAPAVRAAGFAPRVDVYYCGDPRKAIVEIELPGIDPQSVNLELRGRALVVSGERPVRDVEGRTYQQVELPSGIFRRVIELSAEVEADSANATYEDGILKVEMPLKSTPASRQVPIERTEEPG